jgi:hypothetical protein
LQVAGIVFNGQTEVRFVSWVEHGLLPVR